MYWVPASQVFRALRKDRELRHICHQLPKTWRTDYAKQYGRVRYYWNDLPVPWSHWDNMEMQIAVKLKDPRVRAVTVYDERELLRRFAGVYGTTCYLCDTVSDVGGGFTPWWRATADLPRSRYAFRKSALCHSCQVIANRAGSVDNALADMLRIEAKRKIKELKQNERQH